MQHNRLRITRQPNPIRNRIRMYPNLGLLITITTNHLLTNLHPPIPIRKCIECFNYLNFLKMPILILSNIKLNMSLIGIYMIDTFMILMIEQYTANVRICLFHTGFKTLDLLQILDVYYVFVSELVC